MEELFNEEIIKKITEQNIEYIKNHENMIKRVEAIRANNEKLAQEAEKNMEIMEKFVIAQ